MKPKTKKDPDTLLVLSGHSWDWTDPLSVGGARTVDVVDGKAINQLRSNFQRYKDWFAPDNTYFRIITIDTESNLIQVQTYSPANDQWITDFRDDFYLLRDDVYTDADADSDGVFDSSDNCPNVPNGPLLGTCSLTSAAPGTVCTKNNDCSEGHCDKNQVDSDADSYGDACDNCPDNCNSQQKDTDGDELGDVCDPNPGCGSCGLNKCEVEC